VDLPSVMNLMLEKMEQQTVHALQHQALRPYNLS
jgi:hypothetical protein